MMSTLHDSIVQNVDLPIRLPVFEGPLDLLLFLIRKNEIEIYDIPIETVTEQYLEILYGMERLDLEIAGDFFVMAATLMHIKSRMLLPKDEQPTDADEAEEGVDPRWELVQQLIEYRKFKEAALGLDRIIRDAQDFMPRNGGIAANDLPARPLRPADRIELWNVFNQVLRRLAEKLSVGEIHAETVTVADRMEFLLQRLTERNRWSFTELFNDRPYSLVTIVATFLAVLELTRLSKIAIRQNDRFTDILIEKREPEPPTLPSSEREGAAG